MGPVKAASPGWAATAKKALQTVTSVQAHLGRGVAQFVAAQNVQKPK